VSDLLRERIRSAIEDLTEQPLPVYQDNHAIIVDCHTSAIFHRPL
jgi:hypothetical protein